MKQKYMPRKLALVILLLWIFGTIQIFYPDPSITIKILSFFGLSVLTLMAVVSGALLDVKDELSRLSTKEEGK